MQSRAKSATENTGALALLSFPLRTIPAYSAAHGADFRVTNWPSGELTHSLYVAPPMRSQSPLEPTSADTFTNVRKTSVPLSPFCGCPWSRSRARNCDTVLIDRNVKNLSSLLGSNVLEIVPLLQQSSLSTKVKQGTSSLDDDMSWEARGAAMFRPFVWGAAWKSSRGGNGNLFIASAWRMRVVRVYACTFRSCMHGIIVTSHCRCRCTNSNSSIFACMHVHARNVSV
jgi:hypothetical protein